MVFILCLYKHFSYLITKSVLVVPPVTSVIVINMQHNMCVIVIDRIKSSTKITMELSDPKPLSH